MAKKLLSKGFTLIEMSIVLVIIGLIIGGILKGQEVIESSRQKNVIVQVDGFRAAANTFYDKYNAIPGDYRLASTRISTGLVNGNSDGVIGCLELGNAEMRTGAFTSAATCSNGGLNTEYPGFWSHLAAAELISGITIGGAETSFGDGQNYPAAQYPGSGFTIGFGVLNGQAGATDAVTTQWIRWEEDPTVGTDPPVSAKTAFQMDLKTDDGNPLLGDVRVHRSQANYPNCTTGTTPNRAYDVLNGDKDCQPFFTLNGSSN